MPKDGTPGRNLSLSHLDPDHRSYFWTTALAGMVFTYCGFRYGYGREASFLLAFLMGSAAWAIYRQWRSAAVIYLVAFLALSGWGVYRCSIKGLTFNTAGITFGGLAGCVGYFYLRPKPRPEEKEAAATEADDLFKLPEAGRPHFEGLMAAYERAFGPPQWVFHIIPKPLWLHRYADHIITIPPTAERKSWLYGTLLISTLSNARIELILERPEEDTTGAIGTLSMLTQYYLEDSRLKLWHSMGHHPFYGEKSRVRGLLFCPPPQKLASCLGLDSGGIELIYVAGITEEQLNEAQETDNRLGDSLGAKELHRQLRIETEGITQLPL